MQSRGKGDGGHRGASGRGRPPARENETSNVHSDQIRGRARSSARQPRSVATTPHGWAPAAPPPEVRLTTHPFLTLLIPVAHFCA